MSDTQNKRVINIQPVKVKTPHEDHQQKLEVKIKMFIDHMSKLNDNDWAKIDFMIKMEGSLFHHAEVARFKAVMGVLWNAREQGIWTNQDDYLATELYMTTYRETLAYLLRAENLLGQLEEQECRLFEDYDLDPLAQQEIFLSWLNRRFSQTTVNTI